MIRPPGLTDPEWADYLACETEHQKDLADVAEREARNEHNQRDSPEPQKKESAMSYRTSDSPDEITDGNGDTWVPATSPGRNNEPVYYPTTGPDSWALTPSEIEAQHGRRN